MTTPMHETSFKLRHECPYQALSEQFPDVTIREWHLHNCQVLELSGSEVSSKGIVDEVERIGDVLHSTADRGGLHVVVQSSKYPIEGSIIERFRDHNCVYIPPTVYQQGWEKYTVVGFDEHDVHDLLQELEDSRGIGALSKSSIEERQIPHGMIFSVDQLFADLTDRQLAALCLALDNGYYNRPRGMSTEQLAEQTAVAQSTFEEHLRKAENKLITNAGQYIRLLTETQTTDSLGAQ